ncbi:MAG TPA: TerC family protein [Candidatus Paceibacterota bacterium]|nr:TerC family protein [Candidatus Paceibacterota bacterium]
MAFVIAMLLIDLKVGHAEEHEATTKEAAAWAAFWVGLGVVFGVIVYFWRGSETAAEYYAGFLIEKALSVDNMFVFVLIFSYFKIPLKYQHQVLFYGILGAMIFRGIFIALGVALINNFEWIIYIFGAFLVYTAIKIARGTEEVHPEENPILQFAQRRIRTTTRLDGQKLFTVENGRRLATPLFIVLLFIEITDIVFAIDSIPAIFAITRDPFIILTSNVFAILGLRALYFLLAGFIERFHLLKYGLAVILGFVGIKMLLLYWHVEVPILWSLSFIIAVLSVTVILSLRLPPPPDVPHSDELIPDA